MSKRQSAPTPISETLSLFKENFDKRKKYVKNEYQAYGLELADELDDWDINLFISAWPNRRSSTFRNRSLL